MLKNVQEFDWSHLWEQNGVVMAVEIERKFLVVDDSYRKNSEIVDIRQGYISRDPERTVRVRVKGDQGFITVKGISSGASRLEFEYIIPVKDAVELVKLCIPPLIEKSRYIVECDGMTGEVDEFAGDNHGLVVAEIELESEGQQFTEPAWLGDEVTQDPRYYNSQLAAHPYKDWKWTSFAVLPLLLYEDSFGYFDRVYLDLVNSKLADWPI